MITKAEKEIKPTEKQQKCIDNIQGKYLVLAGPGTGKTYTIVERIKNMLSKGINPEKILCLTFTDAAANEMKKRIEKELNIASCDVQIFTYHGFCCNIIEEYSEEFELSANYKIITDPVSKAFIKECIDEMGPVYFRTEKNDPYFYINTIKRRIGLIKQNRISAEKYEQNIAENMDWEPEKIRLEKKLEEKRAAGNTKTATDEADLEAVTKKINQARELWKFYELYQKKLEDAHYLDFNDMINYVLEKFEKNPAFLNNIANRYEYIMVDEYQDTNKSQNDIIMALTHAIETQNVFVVGDDDQIIYRFQGAKLDTIQNFLTEFPDTKIICLTDYMRSTKSILRAAGAVIAQDPLSLVNNHNFVDIDGNPIDKKLPLPNDELPEGELPVRLLEYADIMQEYTEIVNEIEKIINSDKCPKDKKTGEKLLSQIAILTRTNEQAQEYAELFKQRNIPFELKEGKDIFTIPAVNVLYFYIQFLINPKQNAFRIFQLLLSQPFNICPHDYQILFNEVSKEETFIDVLRKRELKGLLEPEKMDNLLKTYDYLHEYHTKESIKNTILEIGAKTGIFEYYLNTGINKTESIAGIKKFIDEAVGFSEIFKTSRLEEFNTYLQAIIEDDEKIKTDKAPVTLNAVQLCTYHSSKGREFEIVYMPTLEKKKWESSPKSIKPEIPLDKSEFKTSDYLKQKVKPSDLTKLMYVAMTRAKHTLRLSYPAMIDGKSKSLTVYVDNIKQLLLQQNEPFEYDEQSYFEQVKHLLIKTEYDYKKDFADFIKAKLGDRAFSPSSINRYLACPRQYLYGDILELNPKDGNPNYTSYGSAVHKACEEAIKYIRDEKKTPEKNQFINWFKEDLEQHNMESYQQRLNFIGRGEKALDAYYAQICNTTPTYLYKVEEPIEYEFEDGTKFKGFADRIDKNPDGTYAIYDYKTGDNKNKGIKIDGDHEDYYNQMAWYKYFYELSTGNKVTVTKFIYPEDFESKNNGIEYTEEEIADAVGKFKQAVYDIKNMNFEPSFKEKACEHCPYKDFCGMKRI